MSAAHTPGPWAWSEDGYDLRPTDESKGAVVVIATTAGMRVRRYNRNGIEASLAEVDANKQLIGAAPHLLAALISIAEDSSDEGAREFAMEAIAKATGGAA
jgi:hypothetical protein